MAFKFRWLCELLQDLEKNRLKKATAETQSANPDAQVIVAWFNRHHAQIPRHGEAAIAVLSCLFPERRPDRVYSLQRKRLASIFGRSLGLGTCRMKKLNSWQESNAADFAHCVEVIMAQAEFDEPHSGYEVTLEELDEALDDLAARSEFSSTAIRSKASARNSHAILGPILRRLQSWEAKWLIRMLLKTFSPVVVPEQLAMDQFHFLLRDLLALQNSFHAAVAILSGLHVRQIPSRPSRDCQAALKLGIVNELVPHIGVMVTRSAYDKARSIKHCCDMAARRTMSLERKYDGEYCQVHIDLSKLDDCITIFSKSGKDSTADRIRLHGAIRDCLRLVNARCDIKKQCILEGELLVWNKRKRAIEPFHKIRKHIQRSGRWLGNLADSPPHLDEHLMIMFYDILLLDDKICLREPHSKRRQRLESLIHTLPGHAEIGTRENINFSSRRAPEQLRTAFANAITQRWEGFVLKGCDEAYISINGGGRCMKLKKDYIAGLGDTADLAIVGGRRDPQVEQELGLGRLSWTEFYIACLENKDAVCRFGVKPMYRIIDILRSGNHCVPRDDILFLNEHGNFVHTPFAFSKEEFGVKIDQRSMQRPSELFKQPFVVEIYGAGFEKPTNSPYFTIRFPRVLKIHLDRPVSETVSFDELQSLAKASLEAPVDPASQEDRQWIADLEMGDPKSRYIVDKSQSTTPAKSSASVIRTSFSVTPNMGSNVKSFVLVRTETGELTLEERALWAQTEPTSVSDTQSLSQNSFAHLNRKRQRMNVSPDANSSSKRVRVVQLSQSTPRSCCEGAVQAVDRHETATSPCRGAADARERAGLRGLKETPPWCKWPGQVESSPTAHLDPYGGAQRSRMIKTMSTSVQLVDSPSRPAPNSGRPLSEITNDTAVNTGPSLRRRVGNNAERAKERGSQTLDRASKPRKRLDEAASKKPPPRNPITSAYLLPTSPTSSPSNIGTECPHVAPPTSGAVTPSAFTSNKSDVAILRPAPRSHVNYIMPIDPPQRAYDDVRPLSSTTRSPPQVSPLPPAPTFVSPILLSDSLSHLATHPAGPLHIYLHNIPFSFTYSKACFLDSLDVPSEYKLSNLHVVIVDTARPETVAKEINNVTRGLRKILTLSDSATSTPTSEGKPTRTVKAQGHIIFLDWMALRSLNDISYLRRSFGGCLAFATKSDNFTDGKRPAIANDPHIRAIWNWKEAFGLNKDDQILGKGRHAAKEPLSIRAICSFA